MTSKNRSLAERIAEQVVRNVCELPDYSSPDDQPYLVMCKVQELESCVLRAFEALSSDSSAPETKSDLPISQVDTSTRRVQRLIEMDAVPVYVVSTLLRERDAWRENYWMRMEQIAATETAAKPKCEDCKNVIDPDWCWCGDAIEDHKGMSHNHSPVRMGCTCGMRLPPLTEETSERCKHGALASLFCDACEQEKASPEPICKCGRRSPHRFVEGECGEVKAPAECKGCKEGWHRQGAWHWDKIGHMHECTAPNGKAPQ